MSALDESSNENPNGGNASSRGVMWLMVTLTLFGLLGIAAVLHFRNESEQPSIGSLYPVEKPHFPLEHEDVLSDAWLQYMTGRFDEAAENARQLTQEHPDDLRCWDLLADALILTNDGSFDDALAVIQDAKKVYEGLDEAEKKRQLFDYIGILYHEARIAIHCENYEEGRRIAKQMRELDPTEYRPYKLEAIIAREEGRYEDMGENIIQAWDHGGSADPAVRKLIEQYRQGPQSVKDAP